MARNEDMQEEFNLFRDIWILFKKYFGIAMNDELWDALCGEACMIGRLYDRPLAQDLVLAVLKELERGQKEPG